MNHQIQKRFAEEGECGVYAGAAVPDTAQAQKDKTAFAPFGAKAVWIERSAAAAIIVAAIAATVATAAATGTEGAAAAVTTTEKQDDDQDDDPAAAETVIIAHKRYLL